MDIIKGIKEVVQVQKVLDFNSMEINFDQNN
jgi:hypothetical protein